MFLLLHSGRVCAQTPVAWNLVWADEFNQVDGSSPDPSKWGFDVGGGGWGNNELESYTTRASNCSVTNGQLTITALKENYTGSDGIARNYTSARLKTLGKWSWTRGRIEARIKIPRGQGIWPAFWMMGVNNSAVGWPTCGEIDIMENIGKEPGSVHGTIHGPGYSGGNGISGTYTLPNSGVIADAFHVFAVEWQTNSISFFVDTNLYFTVTPSRLPAGTHWVYNAPEFLLLNLAVGGNWPGNPDGTTIFPQSMLVDYIRVYAQSNAPTIGTNALANPGFETGGLAAWTSYGPNVYLSSLSNYSVHDGTNDLRVYGSSSGYPNYSGLYQDKPCTPGMVYTANGFLLSPATERLAGGNVAWLEVSFRDGSGTILSLYRSSSFTSSTSPDNWLNFAITNRYDPVNFSFLAGVTNLVAPVGTATVRFQTLVQQVSSSSGSVLFDDLDLHTVPTAVPVQASVTRQGPDVVVSFASVTGAAYQVFFRENNQSSGWKNLATIMGDGTRRSVSSPASGGSGFFGVVKR